MNESAPCVCMASTIMPRAPLPLRGFINAVGSASMKSVFKPMNVKPLPMPATRMSMAPEARNTPMATRMATR